LKRGREQWHGAAGCNGIALKATSFVACAFIVSSVLCTAIGHLVTRHRVLRCSGVHLAAIASRNEVRRKATHGQKHGEEKRNSGE
jgi:hypothetical protein